MPSRQLQEGSQYSHIIKLPLDKLLETMFDYDPRIIRELNRKDITQQQALDRVQTYLDECEERSAFQQEVLDSLQTQTRELEQKADSTQQALDGARDVIRRRELIIKAGVQAYNERSQNATQLIFTPELGIYGVIGNVGVGLAYMFPVHNTLHEGVETEMSVPPEPNRPVMGRQTTTKEEIQQHAAQIMLGYRLSDKLTAFLAAGGSRGQEITTKQDYFWTELQGPDNTTHVINEHLDAPMRLIDDFTRPKFDLGLRYQGRDNILGGYLKIGTDFKKPYVGAGISVNVGNILGNNSRRNNQNNGYTAPDVTPNQGNNRRTQDRGNGNGGNGR